ncbi:hypothetical protein J6590_024757 [Homalodisca vitripennis]|nr:hypothetical protein J6590_024757 [Homalodisca vitripennis]
MRPSDGQGEEDGGLETTFCEGFEKVYEEEEFNIAPKMQEYRLMTSVSGPAFDHKINRGNEVVLDRMIWAYVTEMFVLISIQINRFLLLSCLRLP